MATQTITGEILSFRSRCFFKRKRCHYRKKGQQLFNQRTRRTRAQEGKDESSELQGTCSKADITHFDFKLLKAFLYKFGQLREDFFSANFEEAKSKVRYFFSGLIFGLRKTTC